MTTEQYRKLQEYILAVEPVTSRARPFALAWLTYLYVFPERPPGRMPLAAAFGLNKQQAEKVAGVVEGLVKDLGA